MALARHPSGWPGGPPADQAGSAPNHSRRARWRGRSGSLRSPPC